MSEINLQRPLARLTRRVQKAIGQLDEQQPSRTWFSIELEILTSGLRGVTQTEELSAGMRALRQLHYMVLEHASRTQRVESNLEESQYTRMSRLPGALLQSVRQTNFSIEPNLLLEEAGPVELFDLVSPTAKVVNYLRDRNGSLPFAQPLACPGEAQDVLRELGIAEGAVLQKLSVLFRSRYHTINSAIAAHRVAQVLELASGISPRGLHWSRENPGTVFIESDFPALMRRKAKALRDAIQRDTVAWRGVLHCCGLDALDLASLNHVLEYTDAGASLVVVTEGLLLYFDGAEMQTFLEHMRVVLSKRPRARWLVDFVTRQNLEELFQADAGVAAAVKAIFSSTQRNVVQATPFPDEASVHNRLRSHGLAVSHQFPLADFATQRDIPEGGRPAEALALCGNRKIWAISAC